MAFTPGVIDDEAELFAAERLAVHRQVRSAEVHYLLIMHSPQPHELILK